jgi:hypothetical protein
MGWSWRWRLVLVVAAMLPTAARADFPFEQEPINYLSATARDPVARLQARVEKGEVALGHDDDGRGYLRAVLKALGVSETSQTLVFSKTSFQQGKISPRAPRALYFNDDVYVGFVRGGDVLEFSAVDPDLGAVFYVLDQEKTDRPEFVRQTHGCLLCHASGKTQDVPGHLVRSVFTTRSGLPAYNAGSFVTDATSPLSERWGGWYVTGQHGRQRHMGNVLVTDKAHPDRLDTESGANRTELKGLVDTSPYLTGHSDIVALMVLEHQTQTQNLITHAGYQARSGRYYDDGINKALGEPAGTISESTRRRIDSAAEALVRALLFCGETRLTDPVAGTSGFAERFSARGPRDRRGRSLRDVDLKTRLFRYPCSYLIGSEAFAALPDPMKARVYARLREVLTGADRRPEFAHLSGDDRRAILEILIDTQPGLPADWQGLADPPRGARVTSAEPRRR